MTEADVFEQLKERFENLAPKQKWVLSHVNPKSFVLTHWAMTTEDGKVLFDTFNSEVSEVHTDFGDYYDETGRKNMEFIQLCSELVPFMLRRIRELTAKLENIS